MVFILSILAAPAIAQDMERFRHDIQYLLDGRITIDRQVGYPCTTGAVKRQTVRGFGEMTKSESVRVAPHIMSIVEEADWRTADDALRNLSVVTTIDLCARAMSTAASVYEGDDFVIEEGDIIPRYHPLVVDGTIPVRSMTRQIWSTAVSSNPGEIGSYNVDFRAAYGPGPYEEMYGQLDALGFRHFYEDDFRWWFDDDGKIDRGDYYVGNYFEIDQYAYTSDGEMSRFISMSSPFTGAYMVEDMRVTGMSEVRESFTMDNIDPGPKAITLAWYELF